MKCLVYNFQFNLNRQLHNKKMFKNVTAKSHANASSLQIRICSSTQSVIIKSCMMQEQHICLYAPYIHTHTLPEKAKARCIVLVRPLDPFKSMRPLSLSLFLSMHNLSKSVSRLLVQSRDKALSRNHDIVIVLHYIIY